jgi:hypothetical protein
MEKRASDRRSYSPDRTRTCDARRRYLTTRASSSTAKKTLWAL